MLLKQLTLTHYKNIESSRFEFQAPINCFIGNNGIGNVKHLRDTFDNSEDYNFDLQREIYSLEDDISKEDTLNNKVDLDINYQKPGY